MSTIAADTDLLYPLSVFRQESGTPLPPTEVIEGEAVPEPYRSLLVHNGDMTSRLAAHHGGEITLEVLHREVTSDAYRREVVLRVATTGLPVEYGAIEIFLAAFPEALRQRIVEGQVPLGGLLNEVRFGYRSQPKAFIRLGDDKTMDGIFGQTNSTYYGRCNELLGHDGSLLARIVEVLRP